MYSVYAMFSVNDEASEFRITVKPILLVLQSLYSYKFTVARVSLLLDKTAMFLRQTCMQYVSRLHQTHVVSCMEYCQLGPGLTRVFRGAADSEDFVILVCVVLSDTESACDRHTCRRTDTFAIAQTRHLHSKMCRCAVKMTQN